MTAMEHLLLLGAVWIIVAGFILSSIGIVSGNWRLYGIGMCIVCITLACTIGAGITYSMF